MRRERDDDLPPADLHVGMVALLFGHQGDARGEPECVLEVLEAQRATKPLGALALPGRVEFPLQGCCLLLVHRRRALFARLAVMRSQLRVRHEPPPPRPLVPALGDPCLFPEPYLRTKLRENSNVPLLSVWAMGLLG